MFAKMSQAIFEDLVILQVEMELLQDVVSRDGYLDEKRLEALTQPRSPGTGIRYARLLKPYLQDLSSGYTNENRPEVFGSQAMQSHIFKLIEGEVGYMTPLSFIYAVEHFATIFGFQATGAKNPRVRRYATDYSKKAPEKKQAPPFSVAFLDYLERAVMDNAKPLEYRLALGKLRLCTQASIRRSDLATTALDRVEWCRVVGEEKVLGLGRQNQDGAKAVVRFNAGSQPMQRRVDGGIRRDPLQSAWPKLEEPLLPWLRSQRKRRICLRTSDDRRGRHPGEASAGGDRQKGLAVPLSEAEIRTFRWHSCKNTMPSLMVHCGIRTRAIRHQGAWRKASESMVDLYLRETQVLVIKAQLEILDQVRKG